MLISSSYIRIAFTADCRLLKIILYLMLMLGASHSSRQRSVIVGTSLMPQLHLTPNRATVSDQLPSTISFPVKELPTQMPEMQLLAKLKKMTDWRWKVESKCGEIERNGKLRRLTPQMGSDQCVPRCTSPPETILGSVGSFSDGNVFSAPPKNTR